MCLFLCTEADQGTEQLCQDVLQELHNMPDTLSTAQKEYYRELSAVRVCRSNSMICYL